MSVTCIAPNGASFSNNWWWWRPLAAYCFQIYPKLEQSDHFRHWTTNDGSVTETEAHALGLRLETEITRGRTLKYLQARRRRIEGMPDVKCEHCFGSGTRHHTPLTVAMCEAFGATAQVGEEFECNACGGLGSQRPSEALYPFSVENVQEFANFCRQSDGFSVI